MSRVILSMVARNEADRYLDACLSWVKASVDGLFVWDDRSTDATREIAAAHGAVVVRRSLDTPSFLEGEGAFRAAGWRSMMDMMDLQPGDWVLALDADEFPVSNSRIRTLAQAATKEDFKSINIKIPEIFQADPLAERVDGYWGGIVGTRMAEFQGSRDQQAFRHEGMGAGSFPAYAYTSRCWRENRESYLRILHYGYAEPDDRQEKFDRYVSASSNGHADSHIRSIIKKPTLVPWEGHLPKVWRGRAV